MPDAKVGSTPGSAGRGVGASTRNVIGICTTTASGSPAIRAGSKSISAATFAAAASSSARPLDCPISYPAIPPARSIRNSIMTVPPIPASRSSGG